MTFQPREEAANPNSSSESGIVRLVQFSNSKTPSEVEWPLVAPLCPLVVPLVASEEPLCVATVGKSPSDVTIIAPAPSLKRVTPMLSSPLATIGSWN